MQKQKVISVIILTGGISPEHEISLVSAKNVYDAMDKKKYKPIIVGIDKDGTWLVYDKNDFVEDVYDVRGVHLRSSGKEVVIVSRGKGKEPELVEKVGGKVVCSIGVVFPVLHGNYGEDGKMQGYLEMMNAPYVGSGVLGSAIAMDKVVTKQLLQASNIRVAKFLWFSAAQRPEISFEEVEEELGLPLFVKPANAGSSIGVSKINDERQFESAVGEAFQYDHKVLIEEAVDGREIECSVLGNEDTKASLPGEIIPRDEFYSYNAKYVDEDGAKLVVPVKLSKRMMEKVKETALAAFHALNLDGMARVDFFVKKDSSVIVNEANTIPGFTSISMYPKLWEASGLPYENLISALIELACGRYKQNREIRTEK